MITLATLAGLVLICVCIMLLASKEPRQMVPMILVVIALLLFVLGGLPLFGAHR